MLLLWICPVLAETYRTNTVEGLVWLLKTYNNVNASNVIELEPGDYHLSASDSWNTDASAYKSLLYATKIRVKGCGETPEDVKLIGDGTLRVIQTTGTAVLENLTITNGHASAISGYANAPRGGGVYGGGTLTNCLVAGNYAASFGGGGAGDAKLWQCRVIDNKSGNAGGGLHSSSAHGSVITRNTATGDGGGVYSSSLYDCDVVENASGANGGGGFNVKYATNCVFAVNRSSGSSANGGGVANGSSSAISDNVLIGCVISNNWCSGNYGGAYRITATNCVVVMNEAAKICGGVGYCEVADCKISMNAANNGSAGGASSTTLTNCIVWANICSNQVGTAYGAGINGCTAYGCEIYGNYSRTCVVAGSKKVGSAGGAYNSTLYDCRVHDNIADSYCGGIRACTAVRCVIANNMSVGGADGWNTYEAILSDCDVSGTGLYGGSATRTVFHDIGGMVELSGNMYFSTNMAETVLWKGSMNVTNSLFRDNMLTNGSGTKVFQYASGVTTPSTVINCTVVSNSYTYLFHNFTKTEIPMNVVNCAFFGNAATDFSVPQSGSAQNIKGALLLDGCAYSTTSSPIGIDNYVLDGAAVYQIANPGFRHADDALHPYSLKRSSPLVGKGVYSAWMSSATDIRGDGYSRVGSYEHPESTSVDVGCYQCHLRFAGFILSIR